MGLIILLIRLDKIVIVMIVIIKAVDVEQEFGSSRWSAATGANCIIKEEERRDRKESTKLWVREEDWLVSSICQ